MLDFSISKLAVLSLLALLVLGPEKLPKVAAQLGRWVGRARVMARNLRAQLEREVSYDELLREKQKAEAALKAAQQQASTVHSYEPASTSAPPPMVPPHAEHHSTNVESNSVTANNVTAAHSEKDATNSPAGSGT
jgi:sec-independent protein translocase protein TatB